jgi:zinc D-Ala-D-Ala carboxypeptidase
MNRALTLFLLFLIGCAPAHAFPPPTATVLPAPFVAVTRAVTPSAPNPVPIDTPVVFTPSASTATPFPLPTANPLILACNERKPAADDLLVVITDTFGISPDYVPKGLVRLDKFLPYTAVYSPQVRVRQVMVEPLVKMIKEMRAAGLKPVVRSGYRGYYDQVATYERWKQEKPDRAEYISAIPGHSEHQLGLAVDFYSPELPELVGDPTVVYHSAFDETSEGKWLAQNAHKYGFAMSFPLDALAWTGLVYEPWHYRYIGIELATYLYDSDQFLTKFLLESRPVLPCVPDK